MRTGRPQVHGRTAVAHIGVDGAGGTRVVAVPDLDLVLELAAERHLGGLGLAPEAAEAVLEQDHELAGGGVDAAGQLKGAVDLELHLAGKVGRERGLVDQRPGSVDEQHARLVAAGPGPAAAADAAADAAAAVAGVVLEDEEEEEEEAGPPPTSAERMRFHRTRAGGRPEDGSVTKPPLWGWWAA